MGLAGFSVCLGFFFFFFLLFLPRTSLMGTWQSWPNKFAFGFLLCHRQCFFLCSFTHFYFFPSINLHFYYSCIQTPVASNPFQAWTLSSFFFLSQLFCAVFFIMSSWFSAPVLKSFMVWHLKYLLFHYAICCDQVIKLVSLELCVYKPVHSGDEMP